MNLRVATPAPESLTIKPENDTTKTEQEDQTRIRHDRRDESAIISLTTSVEKVRVL